MFGKTFVKLQENKGTKKMAKKKSVVIIEDVEWKNILTDRRDTGGYHRVVFPFVRSESGVFTPLNLEGKKTKLTIEYED